MWLTSQTLMTGAASGYFLKIMGNSVNHQKSAAPEALCISERRLFNSGYCGLDKSLVLG